MKKESRTTSCIQCGKLFAPAEAEASALPFCSKRCKMVDLGKWINEKYVVEGEANSAVIKKDDET